MGTERAVELTSGTRRGRFLALAFVLLLFAAATKAEAADIPCTDCHNSNGVPVPHDDTCRDTGCSESCHAIDLSRLAHMSGPGTPFTGERNSTCDTCHNRPFEGIYHPYQINVSPGSLTPAGVLDLDQACGQCHGGGTKQAFTTGSIVAGSNVLTVASGTGLMVGARIVIAGAGALEPDGVTRGDFESTIQTVSGTTVTLASAALATVSGAAVVQNPTKNGADYRTKAILAVVAKGIHDGGPVTYPVAFSYVVGSPNTLNITVHASVGCNGACALDYDWDWGDGTTPHGTGATASHTYAGPGTKQITLIVRESGAKVGFATRTVTLAAPDNPPVVAGTCTWDANTWTMTVQDASTDDHQPVRVFVDWGDNSMPSEGVKDDLFRHTYGAPGVYLVTQKAIDTALQLSVRTCPTDATPAYFTISGTVYKTASGVVPALPAVKASVSVKNMTTGAVKTVYTSATGGFSAGSLMPSSYRITVRSRGFTFPVTGPITVGPSSPDNIINATGP